MSNATAVEQGIHGSLIKGGNTILGLWLVYVKPIKPVRMPVCLPVHLQVLSVQHLISAV